MTIQQIADQRRAADELPGYIGPVNRLWADLPALPVDEVERIVRQAEGVDQFALVSAALKGGTPERTAALKARFTAARRAPRGAETHLWRSSVGNAGPGNPLKPFPKTHDSEIPAENCASHAIRSTAAYTARRMPKR